MKEGLAVMATRRPRKTAASTGTRRPKTSARAASALDKTAPSELATVLRALLVKHPELHSEAERIAIDMVSSRSFEDVAEEVHDAVTGSRPAPAYRVLIHERRRDRLAICASKAGTRSD